MSSRSRTKIKTRVRMFKKRNCKISRQCEIFSFSFFLSLGFLCFPSFYLSLSPFLFFFFLFFLFFLPPTFIFLRGRTSYGSIIKFPQRKRRVVETNAEWNFLVSLGRRFSERCCPITRLHAFPRLFRRLLSVVLTV